LNDKEGINAYTLAKAIFVSLVTRFEYLLTQFNYASGSSFAVDLYCYAKGHKVSKRVVIKILA